MHPFMQSKCKSHKYTLFSRFSCAVFVPGKTKLFLLRLCWISQMWQQSSQPDIYGSLPPPNEYGWKLIDGNYIIKWESPNAQHKRNNIEILLKGCSYKSGCNTMKYGCRRKQQKCGPGCLCQSCMNNDENNKCDRDSSEDEESNFEEINCYESEVLEQVEEIVTKDDFALMNTTSRNILMSCIS